MSILIIVLVVLAGLSLLWLGKKLEARHKGFVAFQVRYQGNTLLVGLVLFAVSGWSGSWITPLGDLNAKVHDLGYLGASSTDRWITFGLTFALVMAAVTAPVVWLQIGRKVGINRRALVGAVPVALVFSVFNALTEELIFRVSLVQGLGQVALPWQIALISALLFGAIHYFGTPGKIPGVVMAGFMGWLLAFAVIQTGGIFWAWLIHLVQDVIILSIVYATEKSKQSANDKTL